MLSIHPIAINQLVHESSELGQQYTKWVPSFMVLFLERRLTCVIRVPVRGHED